MNADFNRNDIFRGSITSNGTVASYKTAVDNISFKSIESSSSMAASPKMDPLKTLERAITDLENQSVGQNFPKQTTGNQSFIGRLCCFKGAQNADTSKMAIFRDRLMQVAEDYRNLTKELAEFSVASAEGVKPELLEDIAVQQGKVSQTMAVMERVVDAINVANAAHFTEVDLNSVRDGFTDVKLEHCVSDNLQLELTDVSVKNGHGKHEIKIERL